jgi:tRNA uridine 5-carboxymethylaminomethyl modification enzyme
MNPILEAKNLALINQSMKLYKIAARPQLEFSDFKNVEKLNVFLKENAIDKEMIEQAVIHLKYSGYIEKEKNNADKLNRLENVRIPSNFDYQKVKSLSFEAREKLSKIQPTSISQAGRISGVSPSDISVLLVYMGR